MLGGKAKAFLVAAAQRAKISTLWLRYLLARLPTSKRYTTTRRREMTNRQYSKFCVHSCVLIKDYYYKMKCILERSTKKFNGPFS